MHQRPEAPAPSSGTRACIGVFDSGVGGLSVLRALRLRLPDAHLLYAADSAHAPYGERDDEFVIERSRAMTKHLLNQGAQLIVIACNTATAAAADHLRREFSPLSFVGVEPGIKPAVARTRNGRIGVMATQGTLASERFRRLMRAHGQGVAVHLQACPGLARALESGDVDSAEVRALIALYTAPLRAFQADTVVLGCTHYPFASAHLRSALDVGVAMIDTADAVARQVQQQAARLESLKEPQRGQTSLWTTRPEAFELSRIATQWLGSGHRAQCWNGVC